MFNHVFLRYDYSLTAISGADVNQDLVTGYSKDVKVTDYIINKSPNLIENLLVYDTGLVIYTKTSASKVTVKTNKRFIPGDDGKLHLDDAESK